MAIDADGPPAVSNRASGSSTAAEPSSAGQAAIPAPAAKRSARGPRDPVMAASRVPPSVTRDAVTVGPVTARSHAERQRAYRQRQADAKKAANAKPTKPARTAPKPMKENERLALAAATEQPVPAKRPIGRPSKYDPAFCEIAIEEMAKGFTIAAVAGVIGVSYSTIQLWRTAHAEFSDAVDIGAMKSALHWERCLQRVAVVGGGPGTAQAVTLGIMNRVPQEWRASKAVEVSGPGGGPIQHEKTVFNFRFIGRDKRVNLQGEIVDRVPLLIPGLNCPIDAIDVTPKVTADDEGKIK